MTVLEKDIPIDMDLPIIIIGGGLGGLSAAIHLQRAVGAWFCSKKTNVSAAS